MINMSSAWEHHMVTSRCESAIIRFVRPPRCQRVFMKRLGCFPSRPGLDPEVVAWRILRNLDLLSVRLFASFILLSVIVFTLHFTASKLAAVPMMTTQKLYGSAQHVADLARNHSLVTAKAPVYLAEALRLQVAEMTRTFC